MKICFKCKIEKDDTDFSKSELTKYSSLCKKCTSIKSKLYREQNKKKIKEAQKIFYIKNKQKLIDKQTLYYKKNKQAILKKAKEYIE